MEPFPQHIEAVQQGTFRKENVTLLHQALDQRVGHVTATTLIIAIEPLKVMLGFLCLGYCDFLTLL